MAWLIVFGVIMSIMIPLYTPNQFEIAKSRDLLPLRCKYCQKTFLKPKHYIMSNLSPKQRSTGDFCSIKCSSSFNIKLIKCKCLQCNKEIFRQPSQMGKNTFCSCSCSAKYYNAFRIKPKIIKPPKPPRIPNKCLVCFKPTFNSKYCCGRCRNTDLNKFIRGSRSKAELILYNELKIHFPNFTILANDRQILDGLELDIYIKELNLAIEWNGIFHYEPIRGLNGLEKIQKKDSIKIAKCKALNIELIVICDRTSHLKFIKETVGKLILQIEKLAERVGIAPTLDYSI